MSNKKDSPALVSPFSMIRSRLGDSLAASARRIRLFPSEFQRLEESKQGLRYVLLLLDYCKVTGVTWAEARKLIEACEMPDIRKAPDKRTKGT